MKRIVIVVLLCVWSFAMASCNSDVVLPQQESETIVISEDELASRIKQMKENSLSSQVWFAMETIQTVMESEAYVNGGLSKRVELLQPVLLQFHEAGYITVYEYHLNGKEPMIDVKFADNCELGIYLYDMNPYVN